MDEITKVFAELPFKVVSALLTAALLGAIGFASATFRRAVLFKRHDFALTGGPSSRVWDIQWENLRVTLDASAIHNDHLEKVTIKTNDTNPGTTFATLGVGEQFHPIAGPPPWFFKLGSIVRSRADGSREYLVNVSVLRRRF